VDVKLVVQAGEHPGRQIPIDAEEFVIGRDSSCQLRLDTDRASHRHCRLLKRGARVLVEDLHSTDGTVVNDRTVRVVELADGDRLRIGPVCFRVDISAGSGDLQEQAEGWIAGALEARPRTAMTRPDPPAVATAQHVLSRLLAREVGERGDRPAAAGAPAPGRARLRVAEVQGITLARIADHALVLDADIGAFGDELGALVDAGQDRIVLDFGDVEFLSSKAIRRIVTHQRRCQATDGLIKLCRLRPDVAEIFTVMNLHRLFEFYPDEASALRGAWPSPKSSPQTVVEPAPPAPGRPGDTPSPPRAQGRRTAPHAGPDPDGPRAPDRPGRPRAGPGHRGRGAPVRHRSRPVLPTAARQPDHQPAPRPDRTARRPGLRARPGGQERHLAGRPEAPG
jgi:anti-sigma B factor antagonist